MSSKADYYVAVCNGCGKFLTDESSPNHVSSDLNDAWIVPRKDWKFIEMGMKETSCCEEGWKRVSIRVEW